MVLKTRENFIKNKEIVININRAPNYRQSNMKLAHQ